MRQRGLPLQSLHLQGLQLLIATPPPWRLGGGLSRDAVPFSGTPSKRGFVHFVTFGSISAQKRRFLG